MKNFKRPIAELIALDVADIITSSDPEWSEDREEDEEWEE